MLYLALYFRYAYLFNASPGRLGPNPCHIKTVLLTSFHFLGVHFLEPLTLNNHCLCLSFDAYIYTL